MEPLAARLRPTTLSEFVGQSHLVGAGKPLHEAIDKKHRFSFLLWGPPGVGKTTLARIYADALGADFYELSAVSAGKADIKAIVETKTDAPKVLFLDEIHRFNKAQQDFLLPYVESGVLTLIGATTENPSFEVIGALLSRCQVFILEALAPEEIRTILLKTKLITNEKAVDWLIAFAQGDARQAITLLETTAALYSDITTEHLTASLQNLHLRYDKQGEEHYNTISAFIKSLRASAVDAALYYLARMVAAGEDPKFIARRMIIFASEDIGMAQPTALVVANEVFRAVEVVGYPECGINLAHATVYLATAKKDRLSYDAYQAALKDAHKYGNLPIPFKLRNAPTKLMKEAGYGTGYEMYPEDTNLLPDKISKHHYYINPKP